MFTCSGDAEFLGHPGNAVAVVRRDVRRGVLGEPGAGVGRGHDAPRSGGDDGRRRGVADEGANQAVAAGPVEPLILGRPSDVAEDRGAATRSVGGVDERHAVRGARDSQRRVQPADRRRRLESVAGTEIHGAVGRGVDAAAPFLSDGQREILGNDLGVRGGCSDGGRDHDRQTHDRASHAPDPRARMANAYSPTA